HRRRVGEGGLRGDRFRPRRRGSRGSPPSRAPSRGCRRGDHTRPGDPEAAAKPLADMDLWALVNNAGYTNAGAVEDITVEEGRRQLEVMTLTPIALSLAALPAMRRRGDGRIVNVTSIGVGSGVPLLGWY